MKKRITGRRVVGLLLLLGVVLLVLAHITFRQEIDISAHGVLARFGSEEYEARQVRIHGTLNRRFADHGFTGGGFRGRIEIEGVYLLPENADIGVPLGAEHLVQPIVVIRALAPAVPTHDYRGAIGIDNSFDSFAMRIHPDRIWSYNDGLFFATPAQNYQEAMELYHSFFRN
ncbi:MAG: hypothetical protein LBE35_06230 [Clostridiales bacterium]|jgi:hypothetical protein|nr:hypothetical protein [Clostridiales bacterium]